MGRRALVAVATTVVVAGCGNLVGEIGPPSGLTGISVTSRGDYVIELFVCRDEVDSITILADRQGLDEEEENPVVQEYASRQPLTGPVSLNLSRPDDDWTPRTPTAFEPDKGYIITGQGVAGTDNETTQLNLRTSSLAALEPGRVYVTDDDLGSGLTAYSSAEFAARATTVCG